ncbi:MAG: DNA repair protein RadC [Alphaproteobacteria bacterium]|nr:DNA repair protein RadC [Alphaproteobacteria bacterium]
MTDNSNLGHRKRLRDKLANSGAGALHDYEILELLLTYAIPRVDVKPLAKALLKKFGNFANVINASTVDLTSIPGIKENAAGLIKAVKASMTAALEATVAETNVIANWNDLLSYARLNIAGAEVEEFHALYLNTKCHLIKDDLHSSGTVNKSSAFPREIVKRALELGATGVILAHNHPSGDVSPSRADIEITETIATALKTVDITLFDHIIVSRTAANSMKSMGLL